MGPGEGANGPSREKNNTCTKFRVKIPSGCLKMAKNFSGLLVAVRCSIGLTTQSSRTSGLLMALTHKMFETITRKPCYRKDDRAMRPIYGCPEKFRESSQMPPATFPEICKGLLFRSILRMCIQNLKFVALSVPEIIGGTQKIWAVPVYAHAPVSPKFLIGFYSYGPSEYICQI